MVEMSVLKPSPVNNILSNLIHPQKWIQLRTDRILRIRHIQPLVNVTLEDSPSPKIDNITLMS